MSRASKIEVQVMALERLMLNALAQLTVLKKELSGSGAPDNSSRKGKLNEQQKKSVLAKRQVSRMRKATNGG